MRAPTWSVALATHNGARHLQAQLDSIATQRLLPSELVVYDDASTDGTPSILATFASTAPFTVRVERGGTPLGPTRAFDRALALCHGTFVALADQDDVWYPNKLERLTSAFDATPRLQLVIHDLAYVDAALRPIGQSKLARMRRFADPEREYVTGMASAVRGPFLASCLPVPEVRGIVHDGWLHWCAEDLAAKAIVREVLASYRRHDTNATGAAPLNAARRVGRMHFLRHYLGAALRGELPEVDTLLAQEQERLAWLERTAAAHVHAERCDDDRVRRRLALRRDAVRAAHERVRTVRWPRWSRPWRIASRALRGDYRHLKGLRGATLDLLTPRRVAPR